MSDNNVIAVNSSEEVLSEAPKRKRTRMVKKDAVYTVHGMDAENLDTKAKRKSVKQQLDAVAQRGLFDENYVSEKMNEIEEEVQTEEAEMPTLDMVEAETDAPNAAEAPLQDPALLFKPHRGRKSKAELEAIAAWEAQQNNAAVEAPSEEIAEETAPGAVAEEVEQASSANNQAPASAEDGSQVSDDVDFIIIQDIPIEDLGVLRNYNMYDAPTEPPIMVRSQSVAPAPTRFTPQQPQQPAEYHAPQP
ncbi:MAG: hypothetical protein HUK07_07665, partial [Bacteroidaceae bacterium]|nr:hypothetical protein [Bacteroidaceae bacterium]